MHTPRHIALLTGALLLSACPAPAVYQTADTVEPGQWQVGAGAGGARLVDVEQETDIPSGNLEVWARRGIRRDLDVGMRLYTFGAELSAKWQFAEGARRMALMPGLAFARTNETVVTTEAIHSFCSVPLIITQNISESWSITYGPRAQAGVYKSNASSAQYGATLGGLVLFAYDLGSVKLMPEFDISRTIAGDVPIDGWMSHLGLGVSWDIH